MLGITNSGGVWVVGTRIKIRPFRSIFFIRDRPVRAERVFFPSSHVFSGPLGPDETISLARLVL